MAMRGIFSSLARRGRTSLPQIRLANVRPAEATPLRDVSSSGSPLLPFKPSTVPSTSSGSLDAAAPGLGAAFPSMLAKNGFSTSAKSLWTKGTTKTSNISCFGIKSLHSPLPANSRCVYTQSHPGAPPNRGGPILLCLGGLILGCYIMPYLLRKQDSSEPGINWVDLGFTPPVVPREYALGCGCCWAVIPVQNVESVRMIQTGGQCTPLSVQEIIDCSGSNSEGFCCGCKGGFAEVAFEYMRKNGLATNLSYPINLIEREGPCLAAGKPRAIQIQGWEEIHGMDYYKHVLGKVPETSVEDKFKVALLESPITVAFHTNEFFQNFKGKGIIEYADCPPPDVAFGCNHHVLLVGFGTDLLGNDFWVIQNMFGPGWGDKGRARVRRGVSDPRGVGGITSESAFFPVLKKK